MGEKAGNELLQEAVQYFREQKGFARLALLFVDKYRSLGRCGGTVRLTSLTGSEREFLGHIFRRGLWPAAKCRSLPGKIPAGPG